MPAGASVGDGAVSGRPPVIAIDGPTASGKGTVAQRVATTLGWHYLDSGALYRIAALSALRRGVPLDDGTALAALAATLAPAFDGPRILVDGEDVADAIRAEAVGEAASRIAALPALRAALVELQHRARRAPGLVADGRDMGTVIFPDAGLKVFLTATARARASHLRWRWAGLGHHQGDCRGSWWPRQCEVCARRHVLFLGFSILGRMMFFTHFWIEL